MDDIFFSNWQTLARTLVIGVLAYVMLIVLLRVSGKRTLSKMNAFDFVVTVALGSTLATILLNRDVALAEGVLALALLVGLQFVVTWSSVRVSWVKKVVTGEPRMLLYQGEILPRALKSVRITEEELRASVRQSGMPSLQALEAVVLETDGSLSVIQGSGQSRATSLAGVRTGDQ